MTYIITHDYKQTVPYYVRINNNKNFDEIYNPSFATHFNTKEEAKKWIDTYSSMAEYSKVVEFQNACNKYKEWEKAGSIRRTLNCVNLSMSRPYNNESIDDVIDWWIYTTLNEDQIKYEDYKTWPDLHQMSKHLFCIESYRNKDYSEEYITFQIRTSRSGKFKEFEKELNRVMNKVTYKTDDDYLIFPIFDHYLSEGGNSEYLEIHPKTKHARISNRYGPVKEFNSLKEAFKYIKKERYYE